MFSTLFSFKLFFICLILKLSQLHIISVVFKKTNGSLATLAAEMWKPVFLEISQVSLYGPSGD